MAALALLIPLSSDYRPLFAIALVNYGAVILSFVGALHWGFAMTAQDMKAEQRSGRFIWSVIPATYCVDCHVTANLASRRQSVPAQTEKRSRDTQIEQTRVSP
jgi:hypothetical protein